MPCGIIPVFLSDYFGTGGLRIRPYRTVFFMVPQYI